MAMNIRPYIIAGMHRSGTSLVAHLLSELGFHLGDDLFPADSGNPDGYFEDKPAVNINQLILRESVLTSTAGLPEWGWSTGNLFEPNQACMKHGDKAKSYLLRRHEAHTNQASWWGWKDPRNSLLLPFWLSLAPQARVIAIYRSPWDVVSALQRVRPPVFLANPSWCLPLWMHYNQHLLDFARKYPDKCLLIHSQSLASKPDLLPKLLHQRWELTCPRKPLQAIVRSDRLSTLSSRHPLIKLYQNVFPDALNLYEALQAHADLPGTKVDPTIIPLRWNRKKQKTPSVAIIIPTFNQGDLLLEAIASVEEHGINLPEDSIELLIVNDGSSDPRSLHILKELKETGYRIFNQPNQGLAAARNSGLDQTVAPLILPLDDDNQLLAGYLHKGLNIMAINPGLAVLYGDREDFGLIHQRFRPGPRGYAEMRKINRVDACALIRRSWIDACGGYDVSLTAMEDWDLWLGIQKLGGKMAYLPEPCFAYRHRPNSMIRRHFGSTFLQEKVIARLREKHDLDMSRQQ